MKCRMFAGVVIALSLFASPALADVITGEWCPPGGGRSLLVKPTLEVEFAGQPVEANANRHHVDFVIPTGEPDAGQKLNADQISDEWVRVTIGSGKTQIWMPCKPVS